MLDQQASKIAVFIDFENIALSASNYFGDFDLGLLLKAIQRRGRITLKRAYGDWSRLGKYRDAVRENAVELVQLYAYSYQQGGKNRADIRLVIDVMESLFTLDYIETIVIVSGDSDFSPLMSKAREYGKYTIGVGVRASTSDMLIRACDEFIFYDDLVEAAYEQLKARREEAVSEAVASPGAAEAASSDSAPAALTSSVEAARPATGSLTIIKLSPPVTSLAEGQAAPPATMDRPERETLQYFFEDLRLPILAPDVRANILTELLQNIESGTTLNQTVNRLKAKYDFENVYRQREEIRLVARLAYRAGLFDFGTERPSLSAFVWRVNESDPERANRLADQTLLRVALEANLRLTVPGATAVLFAPLHDEDYCASLLDEMEDQKLVESEKGQYFIRQTDALNRWLQAPELAQVKQDLDRLALSPNERITREAVDHLFETASEWRRKDFVASSNCALRGLKIMAELYQRRQPGLGTDEFLWGVASYCSSRAGVFFRNRDYITARHYYLAFFWLAQEGDFVWELLRPLLPSLLSYFWMTLSHELRVRVSSFTGQTAPADAVMALVNELNDLGRKKMEELASELAAVNAAQIRSLIAQIETAAPSPARAAALEILNSAAK
jgi:uncharacterized LabA/DUF88 family protein